MKEAKKHGKALPGKILFVNLEGQIAGAENSLLLTIKHLPCEFLPQVACPKSGDLERRLKEMGVQVFSIPEAPKRWNNFATWLCYYWITNLKILWIISCNRQKLVHANTTKAALAVVFGVVLLRAKLVWHVRDAGCQRWILRVCSACSSKVIAVSHSIRDQLLTKGVQAEKIEVISNSVDVERGDPGDCYKRKAASFTFANIGQFVPWKKQMLFIDAAEKFLEKGMQAEFLIVGGDIFGRDIEYERMLRKRVAESHFSDSFRIIPWQKDLSDIWQSIDCLIHTADKEPFGRVVIEAMEKRIPVIAADAFGPSEILKNRITGFLFEPDDIYEMVCCMEKVSRNSEQIGKVVTAGYKYVCDNHDIKIIIKQIQTVYSKLLAA